MSAPLLCSVVAAPTMAELRRQRDAAAGADLVELRLDYVQDLDIAGALEGRRCAIVATCRAKWEGGRFAGSEDERKAILRAALARGAEYVDLEFSSRFDDLIQSTGGRRIVLSFHDFDGVPGDLETRVRAMRSTGAEIVKAAVQPRSLCDNLRFLSLRDDERRSVFIGMGAAGTPTRVLAAHFGSAWSYAGAGNAPGQLSAERMLGEYGFRSISPATGIYGVVGSPLTHSISPAMHNAVFRHGGLDAVYVPMVASSADDFLAFADALKMKGASVTIPYKVDLFRRADDVDELSARVGAINTLRRDGARWEARNTDVSGFLKPLVNRLPLKHARAAIIGAGGSARAVAVALASRDSSVTVYARNPARAAEVAQVAGGSVAALPVPPGSWDLLVNATPIGMYPNVDETPFPGGVFDGRVAYDLVYNPPKTRFLREAEAAGCQALGGLDMLIAQAEDQSEWWTGRRPPPDLMRQAALASL